MSYCRWSSDGFRSDVYVYEDVGGGWTTHIANRRKLGLDTLPPDPLDELQQGIVSEGWHERYKAYNNALQALESVRIGLPHDGGSFNDPSPGECADRLENLRALGYYVPQYAIDGLREEQQELNKKEGGA